MSSTIDSDRLERVVSDWLEYHRFHEAAGDYEHKTDIGDDKFWAIAALIDAARDDPDFCWQAICQLLQKADSEIQLANIAAGPLEDLLAEHGAAYIEQIEIQANRDARFRELLGGVWQNAIPAEIWERIRASVTRARRNP